MSGTAPLTAAARPRRDPVPPHLGVPADPSGSPSALQALFARRSVALGLLATVIVLAALARAAPWFTAHTFGGVLGYDDGVYYAGADNLLHGVWPYRSFVDLEPPLDNVVLMPFAALGSAFGDRVGMESARVAILLVSLANVVLIWRLAMRHARSRYPVLVAACASFTYAVLPASAGAENTIYLEPLLNLGLLVTGTLLLRDAAAGRAPTASLPRSRCIGIGVVLGACILLKPVAVAGAVGALGWLLGRGWRRQALVVLGSLVVTGIVGSLPFLALAPAALLREAVVIQLVRPVAGLPGTVARLSDLLGLSHGLEHSPTVGPVVVAALVVAGAVVILWRRDVAARFWLTVGVVIVAGYSASSSYFPHYADLLAPVVAVSLGYAADFALVRLGGRGRSAVALGAVTVLSLGTVLGAFAYGTWLAASELKGQGDVEAAGAGIPPGTCVFTPDPSLTIAADLYRPPTPSCPGWTDQQGEALVLSYGHYPSGFYPAGFVGSSAWQHGTLSHIEAASYLFLRTAPGDDPEWGGRIRTYVTGHFHLVRAWEHNFRWQLWERDS